ncbi:MAG TPA: CxxC-x17-CxxC domain-containing protein [Candidatus Bathyarchaeia archaeon]|nr:CxxC-x17-CxxC domain-containing protein [Candidatus Bathyarchaeia archaeon]
MLTGLNTRELEFHEDASFSLTVSGGVIRLAYGENREMHKAVCAECRKECEVPFKPDGSRPVYCRECYAKRRPARSRY